MNLGATEKPVILFVDENPDSVEKDRDYLFPESAELICTGDSEGILDLFAEKKVAVYIGPTRINGNCGVELLEKINELSPGTRNVFINQKADPDLVQTAVKKGHIWKQLPESWKHEDFSQIVKEGLLLWQSGLENPRSGIVNRPDLHLKIIGEITDLINESQDISFILNETVSIIKDSLRYDVVSIYLWDEQRQSLVMRASQGLKVNPDHPVTLKSGEGLTGLVFTEKKPLVAMPASVHKQYKYIPEIGEEKYESYIGVPILNRNRSLGVLVAQMRRMKLVSSAEETLFQIIASGLSGIISVANRSVKTADSNKTGPVMKVFQGRGVSSGFATGPAFVYKGLFKDVSFEQLSNAGAEAEEERLRAAIKTLEKNQKALISRLESEGLFSKKEIEIYRSHLTMMQDKEGLKDVFLNIRKNKNTAELAVIECFEDFASQMEKQTDRYFQERAQDFRDIGEKILELLLESRGETFQTSEKDMSGTIIVASEINPSQIPLMVQRKILGVITESGGSTSHAAILAKSLGIPAVFGVENAVSKISPGQPVLLDGHSGLAFINPEESLIQEYQDSEARHAQLLTDISQEILDSRERANLGIDIQANIGFPRDLELASVSGFQNVGLFRTEFHFMSFNSWPSILDQYEIYAETAEKFPGYITLRTLDIGADKLLPYFDFPKEENPMLGLRSIRFSMEYLDLFKDQIRAVLLASKKGHVFRILLPMVTHLWELETANEILIQLGSEMNVPLDRLPKMGIMVEVPAVLYQLEDFLPYIDFITVGSNDLVQYLLAVDRNSNTVGHLYSSFHPSFIKTLMDIVEKGRTLNLEVSVCGEMASTPIGALALIALGFRNLSIQPTQLPIIQFLINKLESSLIVDMQLLEVRKKLLSTKREKDIERYLQEALQALDPKFEEFD